jgi:hypothetical protein
MTARYSIWSIFTKTYIHSLKRLLLSKWLINNCQQMEQRSSLAFIYECSHLHVQDGNFSDHPRTYEYSVLGTLYNHFRINTITGNNWLRFTIK